jgi:asparagine synthase (glutamine-hydrolysing)
LLLMCGIAGIFRHLSGRPVERAELEPMATAMRHRGPDDEGFFCDGALGLVNRRLSILDTSPRGHQPMVVDDDVAITFNGAIYNYLELREELRRRGHVFRSGTDTEVVLRLYLEMGAAALERLNGMFAFAIWDRRRRRLIAARDRLGIKPFYYRRTPEGLIFASEVRAILAAGRERATVDLDQIDGFMSVGYVSGEATMFEGIRKLRPGALLEQDDGSPPAAPRRWWSLRWREAAAAGGGRRSWPGLVEEAEWLLRDAVRLQLRSDVPLGVFLSGGIDSSTIVALIRASGVDRMSTFNVAYDFGPEFDERRHARLISERFATDHHEELVKPADFAAAVPDMVHCMEEPVTDAAAVALHRLARAARDSVTVVLSGEGADELFGGYPVHAYAGILESYRRLPAPLRSALRGTLGAFGRAGARWQRYAAWGEVPLERRYLGVSMPAPPLRAGLYGPELERRAAASPCSAEVARIYSETSGLPAGTRMMALDLETWLPNDLLIKADKMTMAASLELRVPFLDHRLVEFAAALPPAARIRGLATKRLLKAVARPLLPAVIVERSKMGFPTPLARMFGGALREYVVSTLTDSRALGRGLFRPAVVRSLLDDHMARRADRHHVLWQLLVLEEWHRAFID